MKAGEEYDWLTERPDWWLFRLSAKREAAAAMTRAAAPKRRSDDLRTILRMARLSHGVVRASYVTSYPLTADAIECPAMTGRRFVSTTTM